MTTPSPRKILLLTASLGSGHLRAARAIEEALLALDPHCRVETLDIIPLISAAFRLFQFQGYEFLIEHAPWVWRFLYQNSLFKDRKFAAPQFLLEHGNGRLVEQMTQFLPDTIVSTQINCHELAHIVSRRWPTRTRIISVVTDYDIHPVWSKSPADLLVVAHRDFVEKLISLGIDSSKIEAFGIPISQSFRRSLGRQALVARFGLQSGVPTLLVMGGSVGFGELDQVIQGLMKSSRPFQVLAVAGRNEEALARLHRLKEKLDTLLGQQRGEKHRSLQVFGFVDFIPELMTVADCFVTKPGGLATTEALTKGLPMVFVNPIPGHEEKNAGFFVRYGVALAVSSLAQLEPAVNALFEDGRARLLGMQRATHILSKPDAALRLAERILGKERAPVEMGGEMLITGAQATVPR